LAPNATVLGEIAQNNGYCWLLNVWSFEVTTFSTNQKPTRDLRIILTCIPSHIVSNISRSICQIFAVNRRCPITHLFGLNSGWNLARRN